MNKGVCWTVCFVFCQFAARTLGGELNCCSRTNVSYVASEVMEIHFGCTSSFIYRQMLGILVHLLYMNANRRLKRLKSTTKVLDLFLIFNKWLCDYTPVYYHFT